MMIDLDYERKIDLVPHKGDFKKKNMSVMQEILWYSS